MKAKKNLRKKSINDANGKKASMKDALNRIVDVVKRPFQKDPKKNKTFSKKQKNRKEKIFIVHEQDDINKKSQIDVQQKTSKNIEQQHIQQRNINDVPFAENSTMTQMSKFFYSNEKFIETFDDNDLYEAITTKYPGIIAMQSTDQEKRKTIIDILNDIEFMQHIFDNYHMNIMDFFRFLFRLCPSVFKGFFIKKIQKTIRNKKYAKSIKFAQYNFQKNHARKPKSTRKYLPI